MLNSRLLRSCSLLLIALSIAACDGTTPSTPDTRTSDTGPVHDGGSDSGVERIAPTVIATSPTDGAVLVALDTDLSVAFSEPMDEAVGSLTLASDGGPIALGAPTWNDDATALTVSPTTALPAGATITLTIADFEDEAGNALADDVVVSFETEDRDAPTVVSSTPVEGSTVDPTITEIALEMSEAMRVDRGVATLTGPGTPVLGDAMWTDRTVRFSVTGLVPGGSYELALDDFADPAGNLLDESALGDDGRLDFTTATVSAAPVVVSSSPNEGQLDVDIALLAQVELRFSEPMDTSVGTLALEVDGGTPVPLTVRWDALGTRAIASVAGQLGSVAPHRVILDGFADVSGAALDETIYLGDGALDFTTGEDSFPPFVAFMSPGEGATDAPAATDRVLVTFSEAMDPSHTTATLVGDDRSVVLTGTWSAGNTILTLDAPMLQGGEGYTIDFSSFTDVGGTTLDLAHPYLGDGVGDFALRAPTGERCGDNLSEAQATTSSSGLVWTLAAGSVTAGDGSMSCDVNGHPADAVVRFRKATDDTVLHVTAVSATSTALDVEIFRDACRPTAVTADAARLRCMPQRTRWDSWLDVPAGDYFIWVSQDQGTTFAGATVTVDEVASVRAGESCSAPLDTTAGEGIYTAPGSPGAPHRWVIPAGYADAPDRGVSPIDPTGALSCMPEGSWIGHDAVVRFDKTTDTSLVTVRTSMLSATSAGIVIARGCDPADASYSQLSCDAPVASTLTQERTFRGEPGPLSVWLVDRRSFPFPGGSWADAPETTIEIAEFEPGLGDTCATAIPLTAGSNSVTATRPNRAFVPACMATGGVTWFRYTPTQGLGLLRADGASIGAVVDRTSGQVLRCGDDASTTLPVFGVPGEEVCVALTSSAAIHTITIDEIPYDSVRGIETVVPIVRDPALGTTPLLSETGSMAVVGGRIWRAGTTGSSNLFHAPIAGGLYNYVTASSTLCRSQVLARPNGLYCLNTSTTTTGSRLFRVLDETGALLATPEPIDVLPAGLTYPAQRFDGLAWDGAQFIVATNGTATATSYYFAIPTDGSPVVALGSNTAINDVGGLAVDATYVYVAGVLGGANEGVFRLRRDQLSDPAQVPVELAGGLNLVSDGTGIAVDDTTAASALFFRTLGQMTDRASIMLIVEPQAATPRWFGPLWRAPTVDQDNSFGFDPLTETIWLLRSAPASTTAWSRLD